MRGEREKLQRRPRAEKVRSGDKGVGKREEVRPGRNGR